MMNRETSDLTVAIAAPPDKGGQRRWNLLLFVFCLVLLTLLRFWLLRNEDIVGFPSGYDDHLYVDLGEHAFWWRPPDDASMLRLPAYPLWIWLCHQIGLPLYLTTTGLAISAWLFLVYALRRIHVPRTVCVAVYAAQLFEINAINAFRRTTPDVFYGIIFIATAASILLVLASPSRQRCWTASAGLAALLAVFVATRSESVLVYVLFLLFVAAFCLREFVSEGWALRSLRGLVPAVLLPSLALTFAPLAVASANKAAFGVFTFCSFTSTAFTSACNDLLAIKPAHDIPYVPVTQDSRSKAYAVSPAFAKLRPFLEGSLGTRWGGHAAERYRVDPREIGGGWFFFALRNAVVAAGAETPREINTYYRRIARELGRALDRGRLPRRRVWLTLVQPDATMLRRIPDVVAQIFDQVMNPAPPGNISSFVGRLQINAAMKDTFNRVTDRRSLRPLVQSTISGWGFSNGQPLVALIAWEKDATPVPVAFKNFPFPAVYAANKEQFSLDASVPFGFIATLSPQAYEALAKAKFIFGDGTTLFVPAAGLRPSKFTLGTATKQTGWLRITQATSTDADSRDYEIAARQISIVAGTYAVIFKILMAAMVPAIFLLVLMRRSERHNPLLYLWFIPLLGFIAARVAVLTLIGASSFNGAEGRYLAPVAGPLAAAAILLISQAQIVVGSRFGRRASSLTMDVLGCRIGPEKQNVDSRTTLQR